MTKPGISSINDPQKTITTGSKESVENVRVSSTYVTNILSICIELTGKKSKAQEPPKKIYCAYWVRTGQCDFLQQGESSSRYVFTSLELLTRLRIGCKYKHEVNQTILNKVGMREIPKWYREKYGASSMRTGRHGNQKPEEKRSGNSMSRNNGSADAETVGSRRVEQLNKWRNFGGKESGTAPPTTQGNVSKGPTAASGSNDLLTQDLLPSYTALNPTHSSTENVLSHPESATQQTAHSRNPQTTTQGQTKLSPANTPQKGQECSLAQGTGHTTSTSNTAVASGTGGTVSPTQRQARRQRPRRSAQTHLPPETLESSVSPKVSGTTNNTDNVNSNASPNSKTQGGALPRLNIPSSKVVEKISTPSSNSHKRTQSTLTAVQSTADAEKKEKSEPAKGGTSEKGEESESAKSTTATTDETKPIAKGLKPGAATDVFGLGIYDN